MYGTVARFRAKAGTEEALVEWGAEFVASPPSGYVAHYVYRMDDDANEYFMAVMFESRDAYEANADSPEQGERYLKWRALLEADPEWHDGQIVFPTS